ncbi:MAG: hypothetical protein QOG03_1490, partial [Actinomycetota bacterium]|nr:hypothetical protein [Actinomycetota bacterium]
RYPGNLATRTMLIPDGPNAAAYRRRELG